MRRAIASLVVPAWAAGCGELAYRYMNDPSRDVWQKPKKVVETLPLAPGARVADLGAGGGYFTWYLAQAVGPEGKVYAVDIDETALRLITQEARAPAKSPTSHRSGPRPRSTSCSVATPITT
jgi:predicted methyltransferase